MAFAHRGSWRIGHHGVPGGSRLHFSHGFLLYAHSGCAYIPGLAAITGSLYCLRKGRIIWGAVLYAMGTLLWFPYILAGAALVIAAAYPGDWKTAVASSWKDLDLKRAIYFVAVAASCIGVIYSAALVARDITQWERPTAGSRFAARMGPILPTHPDRNRLAPFLLFLGRDGVLYRRFLFHDPYAPVGIAALCVPVSGRLLYLIFLLSAYFMKCCGLRGRQIG